MNKYQKAVYVLSKVSYKAVMKNSNPDVNYTFSRHYKISKMIYSNRFVRNNMKLIKREQEWYRSCLR